MLKAENGEVTGSGSDVEILSDFASIAHVLSTKYDENLVITCALRGMYPDVPSEVIDEVYKQFYEEERK